MPLRRTKIGLLGSLNSRLKGRLITDAIAGELVASLLSGSIIRLMELM
jgi:hypothetical protein